MELERPAHLEPHGPSPRLNVLIDLYEECTVRGLDKRRTYLNEWFKRWRERVGLDLYPALRLILPQKDRERATYGLKEITLAKAFITALGLDIKSSDAQSLLNWKKPEDRRSNTQQKATGDFSTVLYQTVASRSDVTEGVMTIEVLNNLLDELSRDFRAREKEKKQQIDHIINRIIHDCTPNEIRWIARIILKDLTIGMKETTVFAIFHPDAMDLFNSCSDLKKISYDLADPNSRLHDDEKTVRLFKPFQPMLCGRSKGFLDSVKTIQLVKPPRDKGAAKRPEDDEFNMEEKLDGERLQLHKRGDEYFYCSRKGKDYTYMYGSNAREGSLTPYIYRDAFGANVLEVILDGEMMVWDPLLQKYLPFGNLKTFALEKNPGEDSPRPCFKIFDILYFKIAGGPAGGRVLSGLAARQRLHVLKGLGLFTEIPGRFEFALSKTGRNAADVENFLKEVVESRGEGLVLKNPNSAYYLGGRDSKWWVKVKPEYMDNMGEAVDVVVLGGNWGNGKRGGKVSTLICGVRNDVRESKYPEQGFKYSSFVRIGSGLSIEDYDWIKAKRWHQFDPKKPPSWMHLSLVGGEDKPDVYLDLKDTFIIAVKAASIANSELYGSACTMRFPRCQGIRTDLGLEDCLAFSELAALMSGKRKATDEPQHVKKKRATNRRKVVQVAGSRRGADVAGLEQTSDIFEGLRFYVVPANNDKNQPYPKAALETMIKQHGGAFCQSYKGESASLVMIYGGKEGSSTLTTKNAIKRGDLDIIRPEWIVECIAQGTLVELRKRHFFHATLARARQSGFDDYDEDDNLDDGNDDKPSQTKNSSRPSDTDGSETEDSDDETAPPPPRPKTVQDWLEPANKEDDEDEDMDTQRFEAVPEPESDTESEGDAEEPPGSDSDAQTLDESYDIVDVPSVDDMDVTIANDSSREAMPDDTSGVQMGESLEDMEYDVDMFFKHLYFYLDTPDNARANGMSVKSDLDEAPIAASFAEAKQNIIRFGGRVVDNLDEPKLTHIVVDKRDKTRRLALMNRTKQPKRRHLVRLDFISFCIEQETLMNEEEFSV